MRLLPKSHATREQAEEDKFKRIHDAQIGLDAVITTPFGKRCLLYADFTASGRSVTFIEDYVAKQVLPMYANTHTEASATGKATSAQREGARQMIHEALRADPAKYVVLFVGSGVTGCLAKLADALLGRSEAADDKTVVFGGPFEHHSNEILWRERGVGYATIDEGSDGLANLEILKEKMETYQDHRLIGSFSAGSNVTGIAPSAKYKKDLNKLLNERGALAIWDYAGAGPYVDIDLSGPNAPDAVVISTHKFIGGPGASGVLVADREKIFGAVRVPTIPGGGTVVRVSEKEVDYVGELEEREAAGTPGIIQDIRAGLAFQLKSFITPEGIRAKEREHLLKALPQLSQHPKIWLIGADRRSYWDFNHRLGIVSFLIRHGDAFLHPAFVTTVLNDVYGIQSRPGCSCAGPYGHRLFEINENTSRKMMDQAEDSFGFVKPGWTRVNFGAFMTAAEVDFVIAAIAQVADHGHKLLTQYAVDAATADWLPRRTCTGNNSNPFGMDLDLELRGGSKPPPKPRKVANAKKREQRFAQYLAEATAIYAEAGADVECHQAAQWPGGDFVDPETKMPGTFARLTSEDLDDQAKWLHRAFVLPSDVAEEHLTTAKTTSKKLARPWRRRKSSDLPTPAKQKEPVDLRTFI
ncbi:hypothetical protein CTAYLR_007063 [Chrysophaeum taylorii]|uniref:Aminotransferase class V domain-containing protein n=1 Tax=Chrysophaeum taylorii TaxID=2483200 RepID=A0AAD7UMI0_9STRA|nr:hypothetical protein CTAYLR_007063 [Chrysophaeum taylorii]